MNRWKEGRTHNSFVNANMKELAATGWMSNRGRQNVASYLIHDLGQDWLAGAKHFEKNLIDYDPCSNYGNWLYLAGVGNDPRPNRAFNVSKQAEHYDPDFTFRDLWARD
jgi:deoxyribodipyrimidine photo-lyase